MHAEHDITPPADMSPVKSSALFIAALVAALLGLTLLDVAPEAHKRADVPGPRSIDCIVASAIFAGVSAPDPLPD